MRYVIWSDINHQGSLRWRYRVLKLYGSGGQPGHDVVSRKYLSKCTDLWGCDGSEHLTGQPDLSVRFPDKVAFCEMYQQAGARKNHGLRRLGNYARHPCE